MCELTLFVCLIHSENMDYKILWQSLACNSLYYLKFVFERLMFLLGNLVCVYVLLYLQLFVTCMERSFTGTMTSKQLQLVD